MLDINEELKNYKFIEIDTSLNEKEDCNEELSDLLNIFTKSYERIGREQYKTVNGIEEILDLLQEGNESNKENQDIIKELRETAQQSDNEIKTMINTVISISDIFDYVNGFALKSDNENLKAQLKLVLEQLSEKLAQSSITVLGIDGGKFDLSFHQPIVAEWQQDKPEGVILQVIRKGYMYKGNVLRKAEVIINKNTNE